MLAADAARSYGRTVGTVNVLFDFSEAPHLSARDLCSQFGLNQRTAADRSKEIMHLLRIGQFDPRWSLPSKRADNPREWMLE